MHERKGFVFLLACHRGVYSGISGFLLLLRKRKLLKHVGRYAVLYFPNIKLGTCSWWAWLLRSRRAWLFKTYLDPHYICSQWWGLFVMIVRQDGHDTAWSCKWWVTQKRQLEYKYIWRGKETKLAQRHPYTKNSELFSPAHRQQLRWNNYQNQTKTDLL